MPSTAVIRPATTVNAITAAGLGRAAEHRGDLAERDVEHVVQHERDPFRRREGGFYGDPDDAMVTAVRKRQFPIVGDGGGIMPFIHLDDAAAATVLALDADGPAVYNVTDDEPAPMREWLPALAAAVGAKPPFHVPAWVAGLLMGAMLPLMTEGRGASNAKARKELGWTLRYPTWRVGFPAAYGR